MRGRDLVNSTRSSSSSLATVWLMEILRAVVGMKAQDGEGEVRQQAFQGRQQVGLGDGARS